MIAPGEPTVLIRVNTFAVVLAYSLLLGGCEGFMRGKPKVPPGSPEMVALDQGYSLLYSTIDDECKVDQVLVIKDPNPQVEQLLKDIGQFARDAKDNLQEFAKQVPTLSLDNDGLPELEKKTRIAISSSTAKQVVFSGGKETVDARKRYLDQFSQQSKDLYE